MSKMSVILKGLVDRTEEGKLTWTSSVSSDEFITSVDTISVVVKSIENILGEMHRLEIQDDKGLTVEVLQTPDRTDPIKRDSDATPEQSQELKRLFVLARRSALDTDSTLEKLANSLSNF